jgi:hypothetical protein
MMGAAAAYICMKNSQVFYHHIIEGIGMLPPKAKAIR